MTDQLQGPLQANNDDLLWQQLKSVPAFRGLLRAVEARFYQKLDLPQPILDIGCGDGRFARTAFSHPLQIGIDSNWEAVHGAETLAAYDLPLQATGMDLPLPSNSFGSAVSNSTLEHIPEIQPVLNEIGRVLKPEAPLAITVPSHKFTTYLGGTQFLNHMGFESLANSYGNFFNRVSRHTYTDPPEVWSGRLARAGFTIERWQYYFSQDAMRAFEIGHVGGIPSAVLHAITGHWILGPWESNLKWTERWARPYFEEEFPQEGAYIFILARKKSTGPIDAYLPSAQPFTLQELSSVMETSANDAQFTAVTEEKPQELAAVSTAAIAAEAIQETTNLVSESEKESPVPPINWRPVISGFLAVLILIFTYLGQSALRDIQDEPVTGLGWFGLSALMLLMLIWYQRKEQIGSPKIHLPSLRNIPQRRWLYLFALFLVLIAPRFVAQEGQKRAAIAIIIWLVAIGIAIFALTNEPAFQDVKEPQQHQQSVRFNFVISFVLFLLALLPRLFQLSSHPFILNGTEASIGLDVLNVIQGTSRNPFSAAWLSNPTLPLYLLAIPVKLFGPSTFAIRLVSPFVGAFTVVSVFLIGQRLYGRTVALVAAVLLLGSHFHIHFSRLGLTNAWDGLLVLLSLGFIAIAWQKNPEFNRSTWLLAGLAVGLSAYLYTSSHLLPLTLLALFIITLLFEGKTWRLQWRHVVAMAAVALVVALPQLLHYQSNPGQFMERANVLGIMDNQSGWLSRETAQTGSSQLQLLTQQMWRAALAFNATQDRSTSYGPFVPLLNFIAGLFAVIGFILALLRLQQLRFSMLFVWISITIIFGGALLENPPNSHRYIIAAPAIMLVIALGLVELTNALLGGIKNMDEKAEVTSPGRRGFGIVLLVSLLIAAAIAVYDIGYYFGPYKTQHHFADRNTEVANDMANYLNSLDGDWSAYFYGPPSMYVGFSTIPFLVQDFQEGNNLFDVLEPGEDMPLSESQNLTFIFLPERYDEIEETKAAYPDGQEQIFEGYYANPLFHVYEIRHEP